MPSEIRTPQEKEAEVIRLYQDGLPTAAVSGKTGVTEREVRRVVREAGITRPPGRLPEPADPGTAAEVIGLYRDGLSAAAVSGKAGVTEEAVCRLVRGAGIMRPRGFRGVPAGTRAAVAAACSAGMTAEQAAAACGVSRETAWRILRTPAPPGMLTAAQAAAVIGASPRFMCAVAGAGLVRTWRARPGARQAYDAGDVAEVAALMERRREREAAGREGTP